MKYSPILLLHIVSGTLGILAGFIAIFLRKGSRRHAIFGNVFVLGMLGLASSGVFMAVVKSQAGNILGGSITFYLVATAWMTARRNGYAHTGLFDWFALFGVSAIAAFNLTYAVQAMLSATGMSHDYPPGPYVMFGSVAVIAAVGDIRMIVRGGIAGAQRIARHLWRMCFAFFIASASLFMARQQLFPAIMRKTGTLYLLSFLPLILMVFWLIRVALKAKTAKLKKTPILDPQSSRDAAALIA